jgi:hypothetical protein
MATAVLAYSLRNLSSMRLKSESSSSSTPAGISVHLYFGLQRLSFVNLCALKDFFASAFFRQSDFERVDGTIDVIKANLPCTVHHIGLMDEKINKHPDPAVSHVHTGCLSHFHLVLPTAKKVSATVHACLERH